MFCISKTERPAAFETWLKKEKHTGMDGSFGRAWAELRYSQRETGSSVKRSGRIVQVQFCAFEGFGRGTEVRD